jgi:hypothetical protein
MNIWIYNLMDYWEVGETSRQWERPILGKKVIEVVICTIYLNPTHFSSVFASWLP